MGGGLEVAIRCHSIVAMQNAILQFPEITLGILPKKQACRYPAISCGTPWQPSC